MGDTIDQDPLLTRSFSGGWRKASLALMVASCGSGGGSIVVTVQYPTTPMLAIASTVVSVYVSSDFSCQDIEYGNVDASALLAAQVASETIEGTSVMGNLDNLPRVGNKMIVARGYDDEASPQLLAAGCATVGTVSGTMQVTINTEVAALVSLSLVDTAGTSEDPYQLAAYVTQPDGALLPDRQVWWQVYGAPGTTADPRITASLTNPDTGLPIWEPTSPECTGSGTGSGLGSGVGSVEPVPPSAVGGFEVEVRVSWGVDPPQYFSEFTKFEASLGVGAIAMEGAALDPPLVGSSGSTSNRICERRTVGTQNNLVCLTAGPDAEMFTVNDADGYTTLTNPTSQSAGASAFALIGVDESNGDHDVYAVGTDCSLTSVFGSPALDGGGTCDGTIGVGQMGLGADDVIVLPACGSASQKIWIHYPEVITVGSNMGTAERVRQVDLGTNTTTDFTLKVSSELAPAFNAAGCVTVLDPKGQAPASLLQVGVVNYPTPAGLAASGSATPLEANTTHILGICTGPGAPALAGCTVDVSTPVGLTGVGFVQSATESHIVTTTEDVDGIELSQDVLLGSGSAAAGSGSAVLIERSQQPTEAEPTIVVAGSFDASSDQDLLWAQDTKAGARFQIAYSTIVNGQPLTAASRAFASLHVQQMVVGTLSSGSNAHIAVYGQLGSASGSGYGVSVVPTGVSPEAVTLDPYVGCSP
jgi:hypothetical protein